jgi:predicted nucleic acid-binding protein
MIVVSDTTPLRYLAVLGLIDLLPRLFGRVHCPSAVIQECCHPRAPSALRTWAEQPSEWLSVNEVPEVAADLRDVLDEGEAAAITLAQQLQAEVILIDEKEGRRCALARGFVTAGTLNILAQAGRRDWLDYYSIIERLKTETNFRAAQAVIDSAWAASASR